MRVMRDLNGRPSSAFPSLLSTSVPIPLMIPPASFITFMVSLIDPPVVTTSSTTITRSLLFIEKPLGSQPYLLDPLLKIIKKKMDIGVSEDKEEIICKKCNGQGNYEVEKVFIKRIAGTATLAQYGLSETFVDSLSNNKTIYSKSKPRFT